MPAVKEPVNLKWDDYKRPDGTTLLPWARGKPMAWGVTVPDTLAEKTRESNLFNAVRKIFVHFTYYFTLQVSVHLPSAFKNISVPGLVP